MDRRRVTWIAGGNILAHVTLMPTSARQESEGTPYEKRSSVQFASFRLLGSKKDSEW